MQNMETIRIIIKEIGVKISYKLNIFFCILFIYIYFVTLKSDFDCSCKDQRAQCAAYITLPCLILSVFMLWSDRPFQREWRYTCTCSRVKCKKFMLSLFTHSLKALFVGLLWAEAVLIDGDWYVCCMNDRSEEQAQLPCKDYYNSQEKAIVAQLKSTSRAHGFGLVAFAGLMAAVWFSLDWKRIFSLCCGEQMNLNIRLHRLILEESENMLEEKLRKAVKDRISEKLARYVDEERWEQYFDVADELIKANGPETRTSSDPSSPTNADWEQPGTSSSQRLSERSSSGSIQVEVHVPTERAPLHPKSEVS